jgi:carbohydrate kinase (thermoresistant glucokinase family)
MIVVVMGVCGCGKTTVGEALAAATGWPFFDADGFHPPANVAKMAAGIPLTDLDRAPWLDRLAAEMGAIERAGGSAVLACSALKAAYRDRLAIAGDVRFVHLKGDRATIASRVAARTGHYMPAALVDSQFAALEPPADAIDIDVVLPVAEQVAAIRRRLQPGR